MTFVTILMATYNGHKYIQEQIDSILKQTHQNFELIIQDDCSTDSTLDIVNRYAKKDDRIKVYCNEKNLGYTNNFMALLEKAQGEYIFLSDQDDVWLEDKIAYNISIIDGYDIVISTDQEFSDIPP